MNENTQADVPKEHSAAIAQVHEVEVCYADGDELWKLVCSCSWECWDQASEDDAYDCWDVHLVDEVHTVTRPGFRARVTVEGRANV